MNMTKTNASPHQPMRAVLYARYSSDMQNPKSVDDQFRECRREAQRQGWDVVNAFADHGITGARRDRPGLIALQNAVERGDCEIVVIEHLDRLSRDQEHIAAFYKIATFHKVEIHHLGNGRVTPIHIGMNGTMAALYLEDLANKTRRGLIGRVEEGKSGGGLSYGYRVKHDDRGNPVVGELAIDPDEAAIVRRILSEYAKGKSPLRIATELNADGIPAPRGRGLGLRTLEAEQHYWKSAAGHRNPEQRTLHRSASLEPSSVCQEPAYREASVASESKLRMVGEGSSCPAHH